MIVFKPDVCEDGYRELESPITPKHAIITGYSPHTVVELLANLCAHPSQERDAVKLLEGKPAEIVIYRHDPDTMELVGLRYDYLYETINRGPQNRVRYLHGCDIMCYAPASRKFLIEMFQRDRCFISLDPISIVQSRACFADNEYEGLFVVYQWHVRPFPEWSEDAWKSFGCQARPHIQFQMP